MYPTTILYIRTMVIEKEIVNRIYDLFELIKVFFRKRRKKVKVKEMEE